ncbi:MAG: hypothetical protein DI536_36275 [Archangium gephyra]|uniref:Uncharacterized protein n=1 Tax=Archangium gephyra TaxID=48 RepID=A0A2W5SJ10_9BACT|nr:MAG: hypothetical protein DI536_36275 [Archangium gephyra]
MFGLLGEKLTVEPDVHVVTCHQEAPSWWQQQEGQRDLAPARQMCRVKWTEERRVFGWFLACPDIPATRAFLGLYTHSIDRQQVTSHVFCDPDLLVGADLDWGNTVSRAQVEL